MGKMKNMEKMMLLIVMSLLVMSLLVVNIANASVAASAVIINNSNKRAAQNNSFAYAPADGWVTCELYFEEMSGCSIDKRVKGIVFDSRIKDYVSFRDYLSKQGPFGATYLGIQPFDKPNGSTYVRIFYSLRNQ